MNSHTGSRDFQLDIHVKEEHYGTVYGNNKDKFWEEAILCIVSQDFMHANIYKHHYIFVLQLLMISHVYITEQLCMKNELEGRYKTT